MDDIPFFDCNVHPTLTGRWPTKQRDASFEQLDKYLRLTNIIGACAVGLWGIESYHHQTFINTCSNYPKLIPIAGFAPRHSENIEEEIDSLKALGYRGIKIHPASCGTDFVQHKQEMIRTLQACGRVGLVVMICTYTSAQLERFPDRDPFWALVSLLKTSPTTRVVLVHAGVTRLMEFADLARFNPNLLLDLSFIIMKFKGSSLELDMKYLAKNLDQRICVGSDFPEYSVEMVRQEVIDLTKNLSQKKIENICFENITQFFST